MPQINLGAVYYCYKNKKAVERVLSNFRQFYPDTTVILINDAGDNFTDLARKYNCEYWLRSKNHGLNRYGPDTARELFKEFIEAAWTITEKAFMVLEDDVLLHKPIETNKLVEYTVLGPWAPNEVGQEVLQWIRDKTHQNITHSFFGSCGGTIYDTSSVRRWDYFTLDRWLTDFANPIGNKHFSDDRMHSIDYLLCCAALINGGSYSDLEGFAEVERNHDWANKEKYQVVHQYKVDY